MKSDNMKLALLIPILILFSSLIINHPIDVKEDGEWSKIYGIIGVAHDILKIEGGYLVTGYCQPKGKEYLDDTFLLKIDRNGNEIWNRTYGDWREDVGEKIVETEDGYVIGGYTLSYGNGDADFWIIKVDENGNEIWNKTYGGSKTDFGKDVIKTSDNGYVMVGETETFDLEGDAWVIKSDSQGNEIWNKTYGSQEKWDYAESVLETEDGYLISGLTASYGSKEWDIWLLKIDKEGNEIWNKSFGGRDHDWGYGVICENNSYIVAGAISKIIPKNDDVKIEFHVWVAKCSDSPPISIKIEKPKEGYLYIFDREILPLGKTLMVGGITIMAEVSNESLIKKVEIYISDRTYEYIPKAVIYEPPYEWKWNERTVHLRYPAYIIAGAYYGNAEAVAVDKMEVYIVNPFPAPASAALYK